MSNNPGDGDDFLEQILGFPAYAGAESNLAGNETTTPMMLQLNSGDGSGHLSGGGAGGFHFPLGLSLEQGKGGGGGGFMKMDEASGSGNRFREDVDSRLVKTVSFSFSYCQLSQFVCPQIW